MNLVDELMKDVCVAEDKANKARHVGVAKEIKIHPDWFDKLLAEHNIMVTHKLDKDGDHTFRGIPLNRTTDIEKWEIVI